MILVDAHTCYDRMQHAAISMSCQHLGIPVMAMICMLSILQSMRYFLRTGHGDSSTFYGGPIPIPFQGGCQGNGAVPCFWIAISLVLMLYLKNQDQAEVVVAAVSQEMIPYALVMFVDDINLPIMGRQGEAMANIWAPAQAKLEVWQRGLRVTGGDLKAEKCYWCWVDFQ